MELTRKQICFLSGKRRDGKNDILHNVMIYAVILERINKNFYKIKLCNPRSASSIIRQENILVKVMTEREITDNVE